MVRIHAVVWIEIERNCANSAVCMLRMMIKLGAPSGMRVGKLVAEGNMLLFDWIDVFS